MPIDEKIDYVQLWKRILGEDPARVSSPDWHRDELRAAVAEHRRDPEGARPWSEARSDIEAKLKRHK